MLHGQVVCDPFAVVPVDGGECRSCSRYYARHELAVLAPWFEVKLSFQAALEAALWAPPTAEELRKVSRR